MLFVDKMALVAVLSETWQNLMPEFESVCASRKLRINVNINEIMRYTYMR